MATQASAIPAIGIQERVRTVNPWLIAITVTLATFMELLDTAIRGPLAEKVKPIPVEERGKLVEFPKETFAAQSRTEDSTGRGEVSPPAVPFFCWF